MNTIVLRLDRDTREKLKLLAETTGRPRSTLVREAVRRFVDAELTTLLSRRNDETAAGAFASGTTKAEEDQSPSHPRPERWNIIV